jgi:hypothetical protein
MIDRIITFIIVIIIIWIWYMEYNHPQFNEVWIDDVINNAKTGDLILFKASDNYNSSKIFCYYTHIGVVYYPENFKKENIPPMLFEAAGTRGMDLYENENNNGIFHTDLKTRLSRYKGKLYYKILNGAVDPVLEDRFIEFISYSLKQMSYEYGVIWNGIKKGMGFENCSNKTNCGELAFLSLIKLGILDISRYNDKILHHLYWVCNLNDCDNNYAYLQPLKIRISPFI